MHAKTENYQLDNYGPLTEPMPMDAPTYDFKRIKEFCAQTNKSLADMSEAEIEQFRSK